MEGTTIKKICPSPSELSGIKKNLPCPEPGCNSTFLNSSNLDMHLFKHHKKQDMPLTKRTNRRTSIQYHCPVDSCAYSMKSEQFFKCMKYLKQHYLKVHAEKKFPCERCDKGFSTEAAVKHHFRTCGVKFVCSCSYSYDSYEALLTHSKRSQHSFDQKYRMFGKSKQALPSGVESDAAGITQPSMITVPIHLLAAVALSDFSNKTSVDIGIQTDDSKRSRKGTNAIKASERVNKRRTSAQTQTGNVTRNKRPKASTQTQTGGDYILKKAMRSADIPIMQKNLDFPIKCVTQSSINKKLNSMETQTTNQTAQIEKSTSFDTPEESSIQFQPLSQFCLTSDCSADSSNLYQLSIDAEFPDLFRSTLGTQTSPVGLEFTEMIGGTSVLRDISFTYLNSETLESPSINISADPDCLELPNMSYFEETFGNSNNVQGTSYSVLNSDVTNLGGLESLSGDLCYSQDQLHHLLSRMHKPVLDENKLCSIETQTELNISDSLLRECADDVDADLIMCSTTETQTTEEVSSLDGLPHNNTYTQTCDEPLFSDLDFVDIQTQTAWPLGRDDYTSMFVSAETQTLLSGCSSISFNGITNSLFDCGLSPMETNHTQAQTTRYETQQTKDEH